MRGQLSRRGAGAAAEARVVAVRAVLCAHDQLAVGEEGVVRAVGMDVRACDGDGHLRPVRRVLVRSLASVRPGVAFVGAENLQAIGLGDSDGVRRVQSDAVLVPRYSGDRVPFNLAGDGYIATDGEQPLS